LRKARNASARALSVAEAETPSIKMT
jgi:hypothetical protein